MLKSVYTYARMILAFLKKIVNIIKIKELTDNVKVDIFEINKSYAYKTNNGLFTIMI